ncbi:MAG: sigma-70 family RNA polymerase sigma factor [Saprospiraceae bacterium]|nr:sigma-70 family RNA polymerase sigma factor [Saprospiraceae bacterium]
MHAKEADQQLVGEVLRGNQAAFRQLVERYKDYVFTVCFRVLQQREEAEEASQDVFIKVYKTLGSFEQKSKFSTWLYTVAYRTALDKVRTRKKGNISIDQEDSYLQIPDKENRGAEQMINTELLKTQLLKAIRQLKPQDAAVVTLFYLKEKSIKEIVEITGLTTTNVKTKLHRTRETLKKHLQKQLGKEIKDNLL